LPTVALFVVVAVVFAGRPAAVKVVGRELAIQRFERIRKLAKTVTDFIVDNLSQSTADMPTRTENAPIVGEAVIHSLDDLKKRREQEVAFGIARLC
jgi:hypothetical protein